jgi:hypothetical protein
MSRIVLSNTCKYIHTFYLFLFFMCNQAPHYLEPTIMPKKFHFHHLRSCNATLPQPQGQGQLVPTTIKLCLFT